MDSLSQAQQVLIDAAEQRNALARGWLSAAQVGAAMGSECPLGDHRVGQLRREGKLVGVYLKHPRPSYRYPNWQFGPDGQPANSLSAILTVLRDFGPFEQEPDGLRRTTGWGEVEWFLSPHELLSGVLPASVLTLDPLRVLAIARVEFESDC